MSVRRKVLGLLGMIVSGFLVLAIVFAIFVTGEDLPLPTVVLGCLLLGWLTYNLWKSRSGAGILKRFLALLSLMAAVCLLLGIFFFAFLSFGVVPIPLFLLVCIAYGWLVYSFFHYRWGRQEEIMHLLAAAVELEAPLAPALRAYVRDRPQRGWRAIWASVLLFIVLPGYYWMWYRRNNYDRKLARLAVRLEQGTSLHEALRASPGIVPRSVTLAIAVGESTGKLGVSLRRTTEGRLAGVWLEALPRLLYPLGLLLVLSGITGFWGIFLLPRMRRIFEDLEIQLPNVTQNLVVFLDHLQGWFMPLLMLFLIFLGCLLYLQPGVRWYTPLLGRITRMQVQSQVLQMMGVLLDAGKTVPEALGILAESGSLDRSIARRLKKVRQGVEQGQPLPERLHDVGLLPTSMLPLIRAAERASNLPWAFTELGNAQASRAGRFIRRTSLALFPVSVAAIGAVIGFVILGMFLPLITILTELA